MLQSYVSPEEELGSFIRRQRVLSDGSGSREAFLKKHEVELEGVTPEKMFDLEKGVLLGKHQLEDVIRVINVLWKQHDECRVEMIIHAVQVSRRRHERTLAIEPAKAVETAPESSVVVPEIPLIQPVVSWEKPGRLDHRGGRY
jgi:hypothetical protein